MYEEHFGLTAAPFAETAGPGGFVSLPSREAALRRLRYGLDGCRGPVLLVGPPGAGKTRIATALADDFDGRVIHLATPWIAAGDLIDFLVEELDGRPGGRSPIRWLRDRLEQNAAAGRRTLLLVDEAHLINDSAIFEALRTLQNFASQGPPDLSLALVGDSGLLLRLPPSLAERLTARVILGPHEPIESEAYLTGRATAAGAARPLFDAEASLILHLCSAGLPRRLNRLADLALLIAYAQELPFPDVRCVRLAARELGVDALAA